MVTDAASEKNLPLRSVSEIVPRAVHKDDPSSLLGTTIALLLPSGTTLHAIVVGITSEAASPRVDEAPRGSHEDTSRVLIARRGDWFVIDGRRVSLHQYPMLARLLMSLAWRHGATPRALAATSELAADVWPGQRLVADSARRRLHSLVHRLRRLGLGAHLIGLRDGYALASAVRIESDRNGVRE